jgi:tricorn protease
MGEIMRNGTRFLAPLAFFLASFLVGPLASPTSEARADEPVKLVSTPALSSDGSRLTFSWRRDIWTASIEGGPIRRITTNPAMDVGPEFSPDGSQIAFSSDRGGSMQVYVVSSQGGIPRQLSYHSEGNLLEQWHASSNSLLVSGARDHFWRTAERLFLIASGERSAEQLVMNAAGRYGRLSPDGSTLAFQREGTSWWRKGYVGSQAGQIWLYDMDAGTYQQAATNPQGCRSPLWAADSKSFYYLGCQDGSFNLYQRRLKTGKDKQLTKFKDDSIVSPCISDDGFTIAFRHLFDLYRYSPLRGGDAEKVELIYQGDELAPPVIHRELREATDVSFTRDGLEIAFIAGGDVWVMDTILREPRQLTNTPEEEHDVLFAADGKSIVYVSDQGGQSDIWSLKRKDDSLYWWQNTEVEETQLTNNPEEEYSLDWSPKGTWLSFVRARGDLWIMKPDGSDAKRLRESWNSPQYDWSPDEQWIVFAGSDADFNRDVFIMSVEKPELVENISLHPDNEFTPRWSPNGKRIAFTGRRIGEEVDIYYVNLQAVDDELTSRDRKLQSALDLLNKARSKSVSSSASAAIKQMSRKTGDIDFDGIHARLHRISVPDVTESNIFWSHDSKRIAFSGTIAGKEGTYVLSPGSPGPPKLLAPVTGTHARWISTGNKVLWLSKSIPGALSSTGAPSSFSFRVRQAVDQPGRYEAAFDQSWRIMRDYFYDELMNHRRWDEIRGKYAGMAREAGDLDSLGRVISLMLGELNGSHLGFSYSRRPVNPQGLAVATTAHLGLRFDNEHGGPGLMVADVLVGGPTAKELSRVVAGEILLSIDGVPVDVNTDLTSVLNGRLDRDISLTIRNAEDMDRTFSVRPLSYGSARALLYEKWMADSRARVDELSEGRLAYLHIRAMNMSSFYRFEQELAEIAYGKEGLVIDVRENGGGSTTDHLLTILTQPRHAITVPRGGTAGYPQDRLVYARWDKPIVVLCNQNSFSNAEIFSHAIKTLDRGSLVGVPTSGSVISTGSTTIMDVGRLRVPFRGWYLLNDGEDMELNGAVPNHEVWPQPGEWPSGIDKQLDRAVEVVSADVEAWKARIRPALRKAADRRLE